MYDSLYLAHHGVKGMKWGVRRYRNKDGSLTEAGKLRARRREEKQAIRDKKAEYKQAAKNVRSLSDEELLRRIRRLEKEKRLVELTLDNVRPDTWMRGENVTRDLLVSAGKKVAGPALAGGAAILGRAIITGQPNNISPAQLAAYMFPNPNKK